MIHIVYVFKLTDIHYRKRKKKLPMDPLWFLEVDLEMKSNVFFTHALLLLRFILKAISLDVYTVLISAPHKSGSCYGYT